MKTTLSALILASLLLTGTQAFAHPPAAITIRFDSKTQTLTAVIIHPVSNPKSHFINKVDIGVNGQEVKSLSLEFQENRREQNIVAVLTEVKPGDSVSVEGYCNLSGKLEKEIKVS